MHWLLRYVHVISRVNMAVAIRVGGGGGGGVTPPENILSAKWIFREIVFVDSENI
jgi:hypothetical protein